MKKMEFVKMSVVEEEEEDGIAKFFNLDRANLQRK